MLNYFVKTRGVKKPLAIFTDQNAVMVNWMRCGPIDIVDNIIFIPVMSNLRLIYNEEFQWFEQIIWKQTEWQNFVALLVLIFSFQLSDWWLSFELAQTLGWIALMASINICTN